MSRNNLSNWYKTNQESFAAQTSQVPPDAASSRLADWLVDGINPL
jgi:hypothetical protein